MIFNKTYKKPLTSNPNYEVDMVTFLYNIGLIESGIIKMKLSERLNYLSERYERKFLQ